MKYGLLTTLILTLATCNQLHPNTFSVNQEPSNQQIVINNRILAKVNDKTISVLDVMKKMEVFLVRYYPQYADSIPAKYQYFTAQWRDTLSQMIDNELMIADAEKLELKITDAEVRETIIERFGPNIMASLDKLQLSYDEAKKMVFNDLTVEKMSWYRIHSKALQDVNPQDIKLAYKEYLKSNPPSEKWQYRVLSIKTKNEEEGKILAQKVHNLLLTSPHSVEDVLLEVKGEVPEDSSTTFSLSEEYESNTKSISKSHKDVLMKMVKSSISEPIKQMSRNDDQIVFRIFHLKNHEKILPLKFSAMSDKLKDQLLEQAVLKESQNYVDKLREKFGYDKRMTEENIPQDFQPFLLR